MTDAELAALKKEHDEKEAALQAKIDEAEEARKKAEERSENSQKVIEEHRTRIGKDAEFKKNSEQKTLELVDAKLKADKERDEARESLAQLHEEVAELKKQKPGPTKQEPPTREKTQEEIDALTKALTDDDRKALEAACGKADDATRAAIEADSPTDEQLAVRLNLLKALRAEKPVEPVPFWKRQTSA